MPAARCRLSFVSVILPALIGLALSTGCASKRPAETAYDDLPRSVSAREYGYVRPAADIRVIGRGGGIAAVGSSGDLWDRVRRGPSLGIPGHNRVDRAVSSLKRDAQYLTGLSRRARPYLHMIVGELERARLPTELALLPEIESRYNPRAVSHMSATGMWQFMPYTGKEMGLKQNGWYDGRNDILASTRGAIAYLKQLNGEFDGDWALTLAAYNAGPARVRAAQRANKARGRPTDYWSLNLPSETEHYVPKLLAVIDLVDDPRRHGLPMPRIDNQPRLELVESRKQIDLSQAARICGVPVGTLRDLNPGLKRGKTLPTGPHRVLVPAGTGDKLRSALAKTGDLAAPTVAARERARRRDG
jgi:membrane-bound lytic murein transglycosylase D